MDYQLPRLNCIEAGYKIGLLGKTKVSRSKKAAFWNLYNLFIEKDSR